MKKKYSKLTVTQWAKKNGVSRQVAWAWIHNERISVENPAEGIFLVDIDEKRPIALRPWERSKKV